MGLRALTSHMEGEKHKKNLKASLESSSMRCFVSGKSEAVVSSSAAVSSPTTTGAVSSLTTTGAVSSLTTTAAVSSLTTTAAVSSLTTTAASQPESTESPKVSQPRGMKSFMLNDAVTKAEILYAIESVMNHSSLSAAARNVLLFPTMFPDSVIASKMIAQRAIDLLPSLKSFVTEIEKDKSISSKSYDTVVHNLNDAFLGPKLEFFKGLANDVEPFLKRYQSDEPLAPFLYSDLTSLLKIQLERFLKPEVLESVDKITDLKLG
ncbi:hypothetical protein JTE90_010153 [Oedothorax gibbosus]|uniref:Uncharacterized protein n=1 Tax=Oedothorax gibbosus TaxID=931172 RepID=A0AAV6TVI1_9ARAC|nr:hypothetical protein JTE90_010153 [Oedothorax gibbosus]